MSRSLSWIDPEALAASLARAGVDSRGASPAFQPSVGAGTVGTGTVPGALSELYGAPSTPRPAAQPPAPGPSGIPATLAATPESSSPSAASPTPAAPEPTTVAAAKAAAAAPASSPELVIEKFEPPASRLHARLEAFMEWVERHVPCQEIFIVDEEGLVLMERNSDPTLIAVSSYFLNFNERIRSSLGAQSQGAIAIDLEGGRTLHVVQAETPLGSHALGFTSSHPLHRNVNESFRTTLPVVFAQDAA